MLKENCLKKKISTLVDQDFKGLIMNWGKGITIFMLAFMTFIGSMVYIAFTKNADLVRDDYYENELAFDQTKGEKANYTALENPIHIEKNELGVNFIYPSEMNAEKGGKIAFYRPDQKKYDCEFEIQMSEDHIQRLAYSNFRDGYYDVSIRWTDANDKTYIFESNISF